MKRLLELGMEASYIYLMIRTGKNPSLRDLALATRMTKQKVRTTIKNMVELGLVEKEVNTPDNTHNNIPNNMRCILSANKLKPFPTHQATHPITHTREKEESPLDSPSALSPITPIALTPIIPLEEKEKETLRACAYVREGTEIAWEDWLKYKRQLGKPYKSAMSTKQAYEKAWKQAHENATEFRAVIYQSIENQWQGTFELKVVNDYGNGNISNRPATIASLAASLGREFASGYEITEGQDDLPF